MIRLADLWSVEGGWGWIAAGPPAGAVGLGLAAVLGLAFGSFLNVVIHRLPREESIVFPPSHCPACDRRLAPWENVPLFSFLWLRGRCRGCGARISWRYPLVEVVAAAMVVLSVAMLGVGTAALWCAVFALALLAVAWIDAEHRVIPDELSLGLAFCGLWVRGFELEGVLAGAAGALAGFLALAAVAWLYRRVRGIDGLGGGDVKLAAGLGAFLGPAGLLLTVMLAAGAGTVAGVALLLRGRGAPTTALPFGSFLAPAAVLVLVLGPRLWAAYLALAGLEAGASP